MITEIELSEIVSRLLAKSRKQSEEYDYSYLRKIGDYIELNDRSCRVSLNACSYNTFQSRNPSRILTKEGKIIIRGLKNPVMKALISQYTPNTVVARKIDDAIVNVSKTLIVPKVSKVSKVSDISKLPMSTKLSTTSKVSRLKR